MIIPVVNTIIETISGTVDIYLNTQIKVNAEIGLATFKSYSQLTNLDYESSGHTGFVSKKLFDEEIVKKVEFIAAVCSKCNSYLEIDTNLEIAYCPTCGLRCIVNENLGKKEKQDKLDKIIGFVERQQNIKREEKKEKIVLKKKQEEDSKLFWKKYGWIFIVCMVALFVFIMIMAVFERNEII